MHLNHESTERLMRDIHHGPLPMLDRMADGGDGDLTDVAQYRELATRLSADLRGLLDRSRMTVEPSLESVLRDVVADIDDTSVLDVTFEIDAACAELPASAWPGIERVARTTLDNVTAESSATQAHVTCSRAPRNRIVFEVTSNGRTLDRSHFAATARLRRTLAAGVRSFGSGLAIVSTNTGTSIQLMGPGGAPAHACTSSLRGQS